MLLHTIMYVMMLILIDKPPILFNYEIIISIFIKEIVSYSNASVEVILYVSGMLDHEPRWKRFNQQSEACSH